MEYTIKEVKSFSEQAWNGKHRAVVKVNGSDDYLSMFIGAAPQVGQVINGDIKTVVKDGKTYRNFEVAKQGRTPSQVAPGTPQVTPAEIKNILILKVLPALEAITKLLPKQSGGYPQHDETNDSSGITTADTPYEGNPF